MLVPLNGANVLGHFLALGRLQASVSQPGCLGVARTLPKCSRQTWSQPQSFGFHAERLGDLLLLRYFWRLLILSGLGLVSQVSYSLNVVWVY
jgi:hypothetical protein